MNKFNINYDLRKSGQDYDGLIGRLRGCGALKILASTWLIKTTADASAVRNDLCRFIDENDGLVVLGLDGVGAWDGRLLCSDEQLKAFLES
jgi:hypothetical protein